MLGSQEDPQLEGFRLETLERLSDQQGWQVEDPRLEALERPSGQQGWQVDLQDDYLVED